MLLGPIGELIDTLTLRRILVAVQESVLGSNATPSGRFTWGDAKPEPLIVSWIFAVPTVTTSGSILVMTGFTVPGAELPGRKELFAEQVTY